MELIKSIEEIEKSLFEYDVKTGMQQFELFTEELIHFSEKLDQSISPVFFNIINAVNTSLMNKDYLLFNDLLEYELKPLILNS